MVSIAFTNGIGKAFVSIINLKHKLTAPFVRQDEGGCGFFVRCFLAYSTKTRFRILK